MKTARATVEPQNGATPAQTTTVRIPPLAVGGLLVTIRGLTPLITHRFGDAARAEMEAAQQGAAKLKKAPRDPEREFHEACYRNPKDDPEGFYFPAVGLKRAMVTAGQRFSDEKGTELLGAFTIPAEFLKIEGPAPHMRADRVVLSGMSRTSSIAYRPEFDPWAMEVPLRFNQNFITQEQLLNLLRLAGFAVGIGDWRVERKGTHGQFEIAEVHAHRIESF